MTNIKQLKLAGLALAAALGMSGCADTYFDGNIEGKRVVYQRSGLFERNELKIYSMNGKLIQKIIDNDIDRNGGNIGDNNWDKFIQYNGNSKIFYSPTYVEDEKGHCFSITDKDPIAQKAIEMGRKKMKEADRIYKEYQEKIKKNLEERMK